MNKSIELTREEISLIAEDCECALETIHVNEDGEDCEDFAFCPMWHFPDEDDTKTIEMRQALLKKLEAAIRKGVQE